MTTRSPSCANRKRFVIYRASRVVALIDVWKMSSIGWVISAITRVLLKAPKPKKKNLSWNISFLGEQEVGLVERQIIYVRDWSVSSDPIICWDVNYTVLGLHVKRQIIEEGKRCATLYLCCHLELLGLFFPPLLSLLSLFFPALWCIYCWVILHCQSWSFLQGYYSQSLPRLVCVCVASLCFLSFLNIFYSDVVFGQIPSQTSKRSLRCICLTPPACFYFNIKQL